MRNSITSLKRVAISLSALLLISAVALAQVTVTLPSKNYKAGTTQQIPITVGDLTGKGVISYQTTVTYDKTILKITGATSTGTLSAGFGSPTVNADTANARITIAAIGLSALSSSGVLVNLTASIVGTGTSALHFSSFQFNEGNPAATLNDGQVGVPSMSLKVSDLAVSGVVGTTFTLPVVVDDVTGQSVRSYQFTVTFDATKMTLTNAATAGTISSSFGQPTVNTTVAGQITVVAAGSAVLVGGGTLVNLSGTVVSSGTSTVSFTSLQFNEGTPAVAGLDGIVTIGQNLKPTLTKKMSDTTIAENQALSFTYLGTDPEAGPLTFTATGLPTGATLSTAGVFAWTPSYTQAGTYNFWVYVADNASLKDSAAQKIIVTDVNRKPVFNSRLPANPSVISRNVAQSFVVSATDPDGGALTYTWKVNGVVEKTGDSTFTRTFPDPHGTAKTVTAVFTDAGGLKDSTTWIFTVTPVIEDVAVPTEFALNQNYPNPFNPTTTISFSVPSEAPVTFEVYNMLGVKIRTLIAGQTKSAGFYTITWDGKNDAGVNLASGIYLYRIRAGSFVASKKMTLLK